MSTDRRVQRQTTIQLDLFAPMAFASAQAGPTWVRRGEKSRIYLAPLILGALIKI
jgi:hypothetical protein